MNRNKWIGCLVIVALSSLMLSALGADRRIGERPRGKVASLAFASADIEFVGPVNQVLVDVIGGGWVTCFTDTGLEFGPDTRVDGSLGTIGLSTWAYDADGNQVNNPRIASCVFDSDTGGTFTNVRTE